MTCIQCGNTPTVLGEYCLECVRSVKVKQQPAFQPTISPTPTSDSVTEAMRIKREEAINLARGLYGIPTPSAGSLSVPSSMKPPPPPPVHSNLVLPQNPDFPYASARAQRNSACKPYSTTRPRLVIKQSASGKGAIPLENPPYRVSVQCGFEVRHKNKWVSNQAPMRVATWIFPGDPNAHQSLLLELTKRHEGKMQLQIKNYDGRLFFSEKHFPFCRLGTRKGSVIDQEGFIQFLKENKAIDLLLEYDEFEDHEEDEEEACGMETQSRQYALRSATSASFNSRANTPSVGSTLAISNDREDSTFSLPTITTKPPVITQENSPDIVVATSANQIGLGSIKTPVDQALEPVVIYKKSPPWLAPAILDLKDLSWDRFGTPEHSSTFRGHDDTGWANGLRSQLDPDGLYITLRICSYRVHYNQVVRIKDTSKIIHAEILDSGVIYPMVAEYTLVRKNLRQANESYETEPNYAMRTYAVSRQFMALFCKVIGSSKASSDERQLASTLRIIDGFPVHDDVECGKTNECFDYFQENDMIDGPGSGDGNGNNTSNIKEPLDNEKPRRVFFFQEKIEGYRTLLPPMANDYGILNASSPIDKILHAFQHWVYVSTKGQMIITNLKGNPPLITKPKVIDVNPRSYWYQCQDTKAMMAHFLKKHTCTNLCQVLGLPPLVEIVWTPTAKSLRPHQEYDLNNINHNSARPQMTSDQLELLAVVRQGQKALVSKLF
ncbi:coiled coil AKL30 [Puccinia graminis f. sp. tritici CRL 75-36-700-3]|uniref:Coiled coil AKL30 n=1 Tax=Puccinia graminis f. sp. tritici (strain CRL 75-36-700-3 / race SCCL) TaxID=418459 RepID=E3L768_PUCGT|nr:coiled coil AKL30 [Puccinia graminis f. sp. tritici CRL 75-36-700-3]EFP92391.2 coiled coil AKL30 [Puccinia graminis f. sp. tritici CRL 75-36-700-3]